ncbi:MAG: SocA family protein [Caldilineaceae bacterium]|nr:SocA family protein [Caldilineaceae bacterium]
MSTNNYIYGATNQTPDDQKLAELMIYIAQHSEGDERFAATKLNKLLFFSDFYFYATYGRSITGQEYQALPQGPCPRRLVPVQRRLADEGALVIHERQYHRRTQKKAIALRDPDLSLFTAAEIATVDMIIHRHWGKNGTEVSDYSHNFTGWRVAEEGESIPYSVILIHKREPTQDEIAYGLELEASISHLS